MIRVVSGLCAVVITCLLAILGPSSAQAIDCDTIPDPPPIEFDSIGVFGFNGGANCWGWIAPDGTEYAIIGTQNGVGFVNVSTMSTADLVTANFCSWRELKTYRNYCYVVSECLGDKDGMMIIDMSFLPDSVHYVGSFTPGVRSHCISIDTARGFCYLVRTSYTGFRVIDLANPIAPVEIGLGVTTGDLHDMTAFNDTVYAAEANNGSFSIWNMANKSNGVLIERVGVPASGYVHNIWPTSDRKTLATTEETAFKTVKIWNSADFSNIQLVAQYLGPSNLAHNAHIEGNYLYLSHYQSGVSVLDITIPECPSEVAVFDTYLSGNGPNFDGCWGVYPHTANTGHVYASNIDGRLFIFQTSIIATDFIGAPTIGDAPLDVDFTDGSPSATSWRWYFGDGDSSTAQNPSHTYDPGLYDVQLTIQVPFGESLATGTEVKFSYVTALAESVQVTDTTAPANSSRVWVIYHKNNVPLKEIKLPIAISNVPAFAAFDSISTIGCRTNYFERKLLVYDNRGNGQGAIQLKADNGGGSPPLPPGEGPIARVHYRVKSNAVAGSQIKLTMPPMGTGGAHFLNAFTLTTSYPPAPDSATTTVTAACNCFCHGDANCDGQIDVVDIVEVVNHAFRNGTPIVDGSCWPGGRTDVDCSGAIDVVDVVLEVNVAFRGAIQSTTFCDPCNL